MAGHCGVGGFTAFIFAGRQDQREPLFAEYPPLPEGRIGGVKLSRHWPRRRRFVAPAADGAKSARRRLLLRARHTSTHAAARLDRSLQSLPKRPRLNVAALFLHFYYM